MRLEAIFVIVLLLKVKRVLLIRVLAPQVQAARGLVCQGASLVDFDGVEEQLSLFWLDV